MTISRWRAPREDGTALVVPTWHELPDVIEENRRLIQHSSLHWGDQSLADLRQLAWNGASSELTLWENELQWPVVPLKRPLIVTGHQPELFHPGVWAKNVAISKLALQLNGSSLNFNVDSDVVKTTSLKLPVTGTDGYEQVFRFSTANPPLPYEEWRCDNESLFAKFLPAVQPVMDAWPWKPVLPGFWNDAIKASNKTRNLPERWIIARRVWEHAHQIYNHELIMSRWCRTDFFHWLVNQFITDHARFACIYNDELQKYRKENRIRSANHPVADLLVNSDLTELPFWAWPSGTTQRGRLCLRNNRQLIALVAGKEVPLPETAELSVKDSRLSTQDSSFWKIRPKALITSMMFRLFLADLFIHGIGGAVYDVLTDRIFSRFWNIDLPRFAIVTATLRLPWHRTPVLEDQPRQLRQTLRSMEWNPDRYLTEPLDHHTARLKQWKQELIAHPAKADVLPERHKHYETIRAQLAPKIAKSKEQTEQHLHQCLLHLKRDEHLFSREQPWVIYPEEVLLRIQNCLVDASSH